MPLELQHICADAFYDSHILCIGLKTLRRDANEKRVIQPLKKVQHEGGRRVHWGSR